MQAMRTVEVVESVYTHEIKSWAFYHKGSLFREIRSVPYLKIHFYTVVPFTTSLPILSLAVWVVFAVEQFSKFVYMTRILIFFLHGIKLWSVPYLTWSSTKLSFSLRAFTAHLLSRRAGSFVHVKWAQENQFTHVDRFVSLKVELVLRDWQWSVPYLEDIMKASTHRQTLPYDSETKQAVSRATDSLWLHCQTVCLVSV